MSSKKKPSKPSTPKPDETRLSRGRMRPEAIFPVPPSASSLPESYAATLQEIKAHLRSARVRAVLAANPIVIEAYWQTGKIILARQQEAAWGAKVIDRLACDLQEAFPDMSGLSSRNLLSMKLFAQAFPDGQIAKQPVSQLPWGQIIRLMQMVKDPAAREFYIQETLAHGWSRSILEIQIKRQLHLRLGKAQNNFALTMPPAESDLASQLFKDRSHSSYATGFIPVGTGFCTTRFQVSGASRIVQKPVNHRDKPGGEQEFACLRTQRVSRAGDPHRGLPAAPVVGQLNLYLSAVDDLLKHPDDQPAIGLLLCRKKNRLVAEYALRGLDQSIAVAAWQTQLTDSLPEELRSSLPTIEEIEAELAGDLLDDPDSGSETTKMSHAKTRRRKGGRE